MEDKKILLKIFEDLRSDARDCVASNDLVTDFAKSIADETNLIVAALKFELGEDRDEGEQWALDNFKRGKEEVDLLKQVCKEVSKNGK